jgi:hypothetical protein
MRDEAITKPARRLNVAGVLRIVAQRLAQLAHGRVQAVFKVDKRLLRPQPHLQLGAENGGAAALHQGDQNAARLAPQRHGPAVADQISGLQV